MTSVTAGWTRGLSLSRRSSTYEDRTYWEKWFPAELISEMREQVRLWFYSMMFMSVTLTGRAPYKAVFSYEKVFDEKGQPMHKSRGNAIWFDDAVEKMGADVMRWLYCAYNPVFNLRFGYHVADEVRRKILTLWNVYGFFVTYAELDGFDPRTAQVEETLGKSPNPLDRWILSALHGLIGDFRTRLDRYDVDGAIRSAEAFVDDLSTWYVRRSRRRFWREGRRGQGLRLQDPLPRADNLRAARRAGDPRSLQMKYGAI